MLFVKRGHSGRKQAVDRFIHPTIGNIMPAVTEDRSLLLRRPY